MALKIFHKEKYYVTLKRGFEDCKKDITITIDKIFENDTLKISLSDDEDPTFLFVISVTRLDYEDLKKNQGLLVDFDNFPSQLVRLLQQCTSNNMFLILLQKNPVLFFLEVVEHNEFKRLVHLSLKTGPATDVDTKNHMADNIRNLKKALSSLKSSAMSNETILTDKCMNLERKIQDLSHALAEMEDEKLNCETGFKEMLKQEKEKYMQERQQWQKTADFNLKSHLSTYQDTLNRKDKQLEEVNTTCKQFRDNITQLENQLSEKSQCMNLLEKEVQKSHIEVATLKAKNSSLEKDLTEKDRQYNQLNSKCVYLEKTVKDNTDTIKELNNLLQLLKKEKVNLEDRLSLSESLVKKNNDALQSTSEQLLKANQIISKQNTDLIEMKEKLLCRTAIALEQEKVIEQNSKEMKELKLQFNNTNINMDKLQKEFDDLKEKFEASDKALKDREDTIKNNNMVIQWLHKKMESCPPTEFLETKHSPGTQTAHSSTPYFLSKNKNRDDSSHVISDESIDFYANSKSRSNLESNEPETNEKASKVGLDPKYLKPADNDKQLRNVKARKSNEISNRGKENLNFNLPKVDYREKKSTSRGSTYRTTPVSAYFP